MRFTIPFKTEPCYNCQHRTIRCHARCKAYISAVAEHDAVTEIANKNKTKARQTLRART